MPKIDEFVVYVGVGIGLVAGIIYLAVFHPEITDRHFHIWFSFIFFSALLLFALVKMYWSVRKIKSVWLLLALFMAVHVSGYILVLRHVSDFPGLVYVFAIPIEIMLFAAVAWVWLRVNPPNVKL